MDQVVAFSSEADLTDYYAQFINGTSNIGLLMFFGPVLYYIGHPAIPEPTQPWRSFALYALWFDFLLTVNNLVVYLPWLNFSLDSSIFDGGAGRVIAVLAVLIIFLALVAYYVRLLYKEGHLKVRRRPGCASVCNNADPYLPTSNRQTANPCVAYLVQYYLIGSLAVIVAIVITSILFRDHASIHIHHCLIPILLWPFVRYPRRTVVTCCQAILLGMALRATSPLWMASCAPTYRCFNYALAPCRNGVVLTHLAISSLFHNAGMFINGLAAWGKGKRGVGCGCVWGAHL